MWSSDPVRVDCADQRGIGKMFSKKKRVHAQAYTIAATGILAVAAVAYYMPAPQSWNTEARSATSRTDGLSKDQEERAGSNQDMSLIASANTSDPAEIIPEVGGTRATSVAPDPSANDSAAVARRRPVTDAYQRARELYFEHKYAEAFDEAQKAVDLARELKVGLIIENGQRLQGKIRLAQGRYTEALELLKVEYKVGRSGILDLDIALCYVKLGDLAMARQFYSDNAILKTNVITEDDLPGTATAASFEASIRFARGLDYFFSGMKQAAFEELVLAEALAPTKGAISYFAGRSLRHMDRYMDSKPYFERAVQNSSGWILEDAQRRYNRMP